MIDGRKFEVKESEWMQYMWKVCVLKSHFMWFWD